MDKIYIYFLTNSKNRIYRHLLFLLLMVLVAYFREIDYAPHGAFILKATYLLLILTLFYINVYWLVPKFLLKNRFVPYILAIAVYIYIFYTIVLHQMRALAQYELPDNPNENNAIGIPFFIFMILVLIGASTSVKLYQKWVGDSKIISELEQAKTTAELDQLKNQITPHFLFNMLNNANVLTKKDPEKASQVLMKLSDLLRYQLYDSSREKVLLTSDIIFLENFLSLEKIRRDNFEYIISKEGEISGVQVPPLLFINFVENAVKHNVDAEKKSFVHLFFKLQNNTLIFDCINSKHQGVTQKNNESGLGLRNIKRTLELLFPNNHTLKITDEIDTYTVNLTIKL